MAVESTTQLVLLGTGTPNAEPDRCGPAVALVVDETPYLVDCGPNVVRRAAAAHQAGIAGLDPPKMDLLFLTHLHSDHTAGLPDLILTPWVLEREVPLQVYGPPGTQSLVDHILLAYQADIQERLEGLEPANPTGWRVVVQEIEPGLAYDDGNVAVIALEANHGSWPALSYRFTTRDRVVLVSGDTAPYPGMAAAYAGADLLLHEVYSEAGLRTRPPAWQRYHRAVHTSSAELARVAASCHPDLLILYHQLTWGESDDSLQDEIREIYQGPLASGHDLAAFVTWLPSTTVMIPLPRGDLF